LHFVVESAIYMEQLVLPEGTWHTECIYC